MTVHKRELIEFHLEYHLWGALFTPNNKKRNQIYLSSVESESLLSQVSAVWQEILSIACWIKTLLYWETSRYQHNQGCLGRSCAEQKSHRGYRRVLLTNISSGVTFLKKISKTCFSCLREGPIQIMASFKRTS